MSNELKTECWCGVPVHSGTKVAAWISIICGVLLGILRFPIGLISTGVNILICGMMLYGLSARRPGFYLPYLILAIVGIIFQFLAVLLQFGSPEHQSALKEHGPLLIVVTLLIFIAIMAPLIYIFIVVPYRSYKLLKWEVENGEHPNLQPIPNAPPPHAQYP